MLTQIKIERFKNVNSIELNLDRINVLVGSNNSGKSTILHAIQFAVSVAQSSKAQNARWVSGRCPTSLSSQTLIYSPLRDIDALAPNGNLQTDIEQAIKVTFNDNNDNSTFITIRKGKNKNISTSIEGEPLGLLLQNIENPYTMIVPGLAGIPAFEEYKPPSIVRKAAAKGDANSVFRNILLLLRQDEPAWNKFVSKLNKIFPAININVSFNNDRDEHIDANISKNGVTLPIDSSGTGVLQAIQIISYYYLYKPQVLILDEPDSHLHPNNQGILATVLKELAYEENCQIIIATHSRNMLNALNAVSKLHWIRNFQLVDGVNDSEKELLLELGALEKGDLLQNGLYKCVLLTEDSDTSFIETLCVSSGFHMNEVDVWSYHGCTKVNTALAINAFIQNHAPATQVVLHRDRDYLPEDEVGTFETQLNTVGIKVFVTSGNDSEWHFCNPEHIHQIYPQLSMQRINELLDQCIAERRVAISEKFIDTIFRRELDASYKGGPKPTPGAISTECNQHLNDNPREYMHGKIVLKYLKNLLQQEIGGNIDLCRASTNLTNNRLQQISTELWPPQNI